MFVRLNPADPSLALHACYITPSSTVLALAFLSSSVFHHVLLLLTLWAAHRHLATERVVGGSLMAVLRRDHAGYVLAICLVNFVNVVLVLQTDAPAYRLIFWVPAVCVTQILLRHIVFAIRRRATGPAPALGLARYGSAAGMVPSSLTLDGRNGQAPASGSFPKTPSSGNNPWTGGAPVVEGLPRTPVSVMSGVGTTIRPRLADVPTEPSFLVTTRRELSRIGRELLLDMRSADSGEEVDRSPSLSGSPTSVQAERGDSWVMTPLGQAVTLEDKCPVRSSGEGGARWLSVQAEADGARGSGSWNEGSTSTPSASGPGFTHSPHHSLSKPANLDLRKRTLSVSTPPATPPRPQLLPPKLSGRHLPAHDLQDTQRLSVYSHQWIEARPSSDTSRAEAGHGVQQDDHTRHGRSTSEELVKADITRELALDHPLAMHGDSSSCSPVTLSTAASSYFGSSTTSSRPSTTFPPQPDEDLLKLLGVSKAEWAEWHGQRTSFVELAETRGSSWRRSWERQRWEQEGEMDRRMRDKLAGERGRRGERRAVEGVSA